jgi:hypothetical protein
MQKLGRYFSHFEKEKAKDVLFSSFFSLRIDGLQDDRGAISQLIIQILTSQHLDSTLT